MRRAGFLALLVCCALASTAESAIVVDFDDAGKWIGNGSLTSYQSNHQYVDQGLLFTGGPALRNTTSAQDGFAGALGTFSWRLQNVAGVSFTATYQDTTAGGGFVSGFGFDVRRWDGSPSPAFSIDYSTDGGANFTNVGTIDNTLLNNSSDWFSFSHSFAAVNVADNDFIVRLASSGATERIMFDNFSLAATAVPEPTSLAVLGIAAGFVAVRRRMQRCSISSKG